MKIVVFGATGMVGHGTLLQCLADPGISEVITVVRRPMGIVHAKLREVIHGDQLDLEPVAEALTGLDACLYCLGISSAGLKEDAYRRITLDMPVEACRLLARVSPGLAFVYVSGRSTDSTETGRVMWARVKGMAENRVKAAFEQAYLFRPAVIRPAKGVRSSSAWIRVAYALAWPLWPVLARFPGLYTTSETLGRAMIAAVRARGPARIVECREINELGSSSPTG